jgi:hypothetical protein
VNVLAGNMDTIRKNTENLIDASKEAGLELNAERTTYKYKYMLLSHHQNTGQNHDIKIVNKTVENAAQFQYFGMTASNQNLIQEEIKRRLNSGNACYHSVHNLLSPHLLSENIKIRIYKTTSIIMSAVLYGYETCSLTLR